MTLVSKVKESLESAKSSAMVGMTGRELALRVYRDLIRRRTTVRIHQAEWPPKAVDLNFLLSAYRAGSTPLRYSLSMHDSVAAPPESDILLPFLESLADERVRSGWDSLGFEGNHVQELFSTLCNYSFGTYADSLSDLSPERMVILKEPGYASHSEALHSMFEESKFVLLFRHPLGAVGSLTGGGEFEPDFPSYWELFPNGPASNGVEICMRSAKYWNHITESMLSISDSQRSLVLRYEDLCADSEVELRRVLAWLGLAWTDSVLNYDASKSDRGREGNKALGHSGFSVATADPLRRWGTTSPHVLSKVWGECLELASQLNYECPKYG